MTDTQLALTADERAYLIELLEATLKNKMIEEHRTRTLTYRNVVVHEEDLLKQLLGKLGKPQA